MKRVLMTALTAGLLAGVAGGLPSNVEASPASHLRSAGAPEQIDGWRWNECRFGGLQGPAWTVKEIILTIRCAEEQWSVPGGADKALAVARCESGADLKDPGGDGYAGPFQQAERYWLGRWRAYNPERWDRGLVNSAANPRSNTIVSLRMAHARGWERDWSCA